MGNFQEASLQWWPMSYDPNYLGVLDLRDLWSGELASL